MTAVVPASTPVVSSSESEAAIPAASIETLARHEAGHALVCFLLYGEHVVKSLAVGHGVEAGMTTYSLMPVPIACRPPAGVPRRGTPAPVSVDGIVDAYGVMTYAGLAAEALFASEARVRRARPKAPDLETAAPDLRGRALRDRSELQRLAALVGAERSATHFFVEYWEEALRLLRLHWDAVETLAELLSEHERLNGARVDEALGANRQV